MDSDFIVIGGGFAGSSVAYFLSRMASVTLLEREPAFGTQSSGRSAEQYTVGITADTMRALAVVSRPFLDSPPEGFCEGSLMTQRGSLTVGRKDQAQKLQALYDRLASSGVEVQMLHGEDAHREFPLLRPEGVDLGVLEPNAADIDGNSLLQGYIRGARRQGATILSDAGVSAILREGDRWRVVTTQGDFTAGTIVNAAGAWVDQIGKLAGVTPVDIRPLRRTAFTFLAPSDVDVTHWPHVCNADYRWYLKPETGRFMGSLAEEVLTEPGEVFPDDLDVAQGIHNIEQDTLITVPRPQSTWAGLRNFVAGRNPLAGARAAEPGFVWLAGHGGCGVLTSPGLAQAAAAIACGEDLPEEFGALGITKAALSPDRL